MPFYSVWRKVYFSQIQLIRYSDQYPRKAHKTALRGDSKKYLQPFNLTEKAALSGDIYNWTKL